MPIKLKDADWTKKGWQSLRPQQFKDIGMGEALEGFKKYYKLGATGTFDKAEEDDAMDKAQKITIALRKAGALVTKIKEPPVKKEALELIEAYETELAAFQKELDPLIAKGKIKKEVDGLTIDDVIEDRHLFKNFTDYTHNEDVYQFSVVMKTKGKKGDRRDFDTFIKPGGKKEINIDGYLKAKEAQKVMIKMAEDEDAGQEVSWRDADWEAFYTSSVQHLRKETRAFLNWQEKYTQERIKKEV
jgi:hypothetical protein